MKMNTFSLAIYIKREDTFCVSPVLSRCHLEYNYFTDKTLSMKLLSLLTVAIVLFGITTQAFACNYERMSRIPNYAKITTPKKILNVPNAHGICVAPNGNFAVVSWNNAGKIYMYYSCGKLMKVVTLRGFGNFVDCAFTDRNLYVTGYTARKLYELTANGKFIRVIATGVTFCGITACHDKVYVTTNHGGQNVFIYNGNGKLLRRISVPGGARRVIVGIDGNLHVSNGGRRQVYTYTPKGRQVGVTTYKEVKYADGPVMDTAGNLLIADHARGKVEVYSPCGALIKTIRTRTRYAVDVEIGNDGTVMVADHGASKVFLY